MSDFSSNEEIKLTSQLEALLFVADGPVSVGELADCVGKKNPEVEKSLKELGEYFLKERRGIRLQWHASKVQLTSSPELAKLVENFLGLEATARFTAGLKDPADPSFFQPLLIFYSILDYPRSRNYLPLKKKPRCLLSDQIRY
jgi:segregation and condensation protein B